MLGGEAAIQSVLCIAPRVVRPVPVVGLRSGMPLTLVEAAAILLVLWIAPRVVGL